MPKLHASEPGQAWIEGLLLDRIALQAGDVAPRHVEAPVAVEADVADAGRAVRDGAVVAAGVAADAPAVTTLVERSLSGTCRQGHLERGHA